MRIACSGLIALFALCFSSAHAQVETFKQLVGVSGVAVTKLDGSAKGGAAFSVSADLGLPVAFVGIGEAAADLRAFSAPDFVRNLVP